VSAVPLIELTSVSCSRAEAGVQASVAGISMWVAPRSVTILTGEPGCGKNLILRLLGLLDPPDAGEVIFDGAPTARMTDEGRAELRARRCGYVFASPFLLSQFNVTENIAMPIFKVSKLGPAAAQERTEELIKFAGLANVATATEIPRELQHRVALARALCNDPVALFVENLDALLDSAELPSFRRLLHEAARHYGVAVVATALPSLADAPAERRLAIAGGRILSKAAL
jgi:lipoprotein-releasing system ATP-binding protein